MSRYRPPTAKSSPYITQNGAEKLRAELNLLWKIERPQVTQTIHEAAKNGDRSENGDYIYGKKRLREIDRRVRYLRNRLDQVTVVHRAPPNQNKVYFGAWITLLDDEGNENCWHIVGSDEIDPQQNHISIDSPVARQAVGKTLDDEITVRVNGNQLNYVITKIDYQD